MVVGTRVKRRQREEILDRFPEELIEEILKRLPVRSLVRFSCTCKRWRSLIFSDSKFNKSHLHHAKRPSWKFQEIHYGRTFERTIDCNCNIVVSLPRKETLTAYCPEVLGSCNGLLFVRSWGASGSAAHDHAYCLWNPYTNSVRKMIDGGVEITGKMCGLSYDRANDDYKAVVVQAYQSPRKQSAFVFSLRRNSWKKLSDLTFGIFRRADLGYDRSGITLDNGICYWRIKQVEFPRTSSIICFDPVMEKFKKVPLPDKWPSQKGQLFQIGALDGCLSLIHINNIWVMKEHGCWIKLHVLELNSVEQMGEINTYKPLGYNSSKDQMVLIARGPRNLDWRIWIADLNKGVLRKPSGEQLRLRYYYAVPYSESRLIRSYYYYAVPYSESLLCPWVGITTDIKEVPQLQSGHK